jgi:hypothetical protein
VPGNGGPGRLSAIANRVADNLTAAFTLLALLAYAVLRLIFGAFYGHFGLTPEEVGYDYPTILASSLPGFAVFGVVGLLLAAAFYVMSRQSLTPVSRRLMLVYTVVAPLYLLLTVFFFAGLQEAAIGHDAEQGGRVEGVSLFGVVPLLPWRVEPAAVTPASTRFGGAGVSDLATRCLMYLGTKDSSYLLYDVQKRETERIPVFVATLEIGHFASGCPHPRS